MKKCWIILSHFSLQVGYKKVLVNVIIQFAIQIVLQILNDRPLKCFLLTFTIKQELFLARLLML